MSPRPRRDHLRRPEILNAAVDAVRHHGFEGARLSDVSRRLGVTTAMPLYYWDRKDQMLDEALMHGDRQFWADLEARLRGVPQASARLEQLLCRSSSADDMWPIWIELWSRALHNRDMADAHLRLEAGFRNILAGVVEDGCAAGTFTTDDVSHCVSGISALLDGCAVQFILDDFAMPPERLRQLLLDVSGRLVGATLSTTGWPLDHVANRPRPSLSASAARATGSRAATRALSRHDRSAEILTATAAVARERGLPRTRLSDIAAHLGTSVGTPLYYYDNLDQLLEAMLTKLRRDWLDNLRRELESTPDPRAQLVLAVNRALPDDPASGIWTLWIDVWCQALRHPGMAALRARLDGAWRELLTGVIARGRAEDHFPAGDPSYVALTLACLLDGFGAQRVLGSETRPAPALRTFCLEVIGSQLGDAQLSAACA